MKGFVAQRASVWLVTGMRESVTFIVAFLVEAFSADVANERLDALMNATVSVESRRPVEGLSTCETTMRLVGRVDDLVAAQRRRLTKAFATNLPIVYIGTQ